MKAVWKGIISVLVMVAFISCNFSIGSGKYHPTIDTSHYCHLKFATEAISNEIRHIDNKRLDVNTTIGALDVFYYAHVVNDFVVVNDSILLHIDSSSDAIVEWDKRWREIDASIIPDSIPYFGPEQPYSQIEKVIFLEEEDTGYFYSFDDTIDFPVPCWKVKYKDGTTLLHNFEGNVIGSGIPAPSEKGFSLNGECSEEKPNDYHEYRENADKWFSKWCDSTISLFRPSTDEISNIVRDSSVSCFYELAHGGWQGFCPTLECDDVYTPTQASRDMQGRPPMKFAFIGSCGGMSYTGPGSLSYTFRKGCMQGTVTVGFDLEEDGDGWPFAHRWQDYMFGKMDANYTIKQAFDMACQRYPQTADEMMFKGDPNLKITDPMQAQYPEIPETPTGPTKVNRLKTYTYYTTTTDPNDDYLYYQWDWGDGTYNGTWYGPYESGEIVSAEHNFDWLGEVPPKSKFNIKVRAKDEYGHTSEWSDVLQAMELSLHRAPILDWLFSWFTNLVEPL